jgi:hypothetical protein
MAIGGMILFAQLPGSARAGIHTWDVGEVFTNADGTIQFVEFFEAGGGNFETGVANGSTSSTAGSKSFSWTSPAVTNTANKRFLVGSQTFANLTGAPPVDAIMPLSVLPFFFQPAGDTVNFVVYDACTFTGAPSNGIGSRNCVTDVNDAANSPTNYAGTAGTVIASLSQGLIDNFTNATTQNWAGGSSPTNVSTGGPAGAGDRYLQISAAASPLGTFNESQWAGNATAGNVTHIKADLNDLGANPVTVRVMLLTPGCEGGGTACTAWTSTTGTALAAGSGWVTAQFSIAEANLTRVWGANSYAASMANVERVLIRHDDGAPDGPHTPVVVTSTLGIDNVQALPEPTALFGLAAGAALIAGLRRRS